MDHAYLAGVLDADGSFSIVRHKRADLERGYDFHVVVQLTWADTPAAQRVLGELHDTYGGALYYRRGAKLGYRRIVKFNIGARKAEVLIRDVLPHLRLKREQAALCLQAIELGRAPGLIRYRRTPPEVWAQREQLARRCRALNAA